MAEETKTKVYEISVEATDAVKELTRLREESSKLRKEMVDLAEQGKVNDDAYTTAAQKLKAVTSETAKYEKQVQSQITMQSEHGKKMKEYETDIDAVKTSMNAMASEPLKKLVDLQTEIKKQQDMQKALGPVTEKNAESYYSLEARIRNLKSEAAKYQKEIQNDITQQRANEGSLKSLRAELSNLTKQYDELSESDRMGEVGKKLQSQINSVTATLKGAEQETGRFYRNVGNYANSAIEAFVAFGGSANGIINPLKNVKLGLDAISKTGIIGIISLIAAGLQKLINGLKSSESTMNRVRQAMSAFSGAGVVLEKFLQSLGKGVAWVAEKLAGMADKLGLISEESKAMQKITKDEIALQKAERDAVKANAKDRLDASELRAKAAQKDKYSGQERIKFLEEAIDIEKRIADRELKLAEDRFSILEQKAALTENDKETNDQLAEAEAALYGARTAYNDKTRELYAQIVEARNQVKAENVAAAKAEEAADAEALKKRKKFIKDYNDAINAEAKRRADIIKREAELRMGQMDKESAEYQQALALELELQAEAEIKKLEQEEGTANLIRLIREQLARDLAELDEETFGGMNDMLLNAADETLAQINKANEDIANAKEEQKQRTMDMVVSSVDSFNQLFEAMSAQAAERIAARYDSEQEALDRKLDSQLISQEEYEKQTEELEKQRAKEEAKLARQDAIRERVNALFNIALSTAQGVMQSVAQFPLTGGLPWSAIVSALGAVQAAAVMAQPLPQAAKGKYIQGPSHAMGGVPIEVEGGEAIINKRSTSAFLPLLSAINQAGGGIPFVKPGTDGGYAIRSSLSSSKGMTRADMEKAIDAAFSKVHIAVAVEDIRREDKKYADIESNGTF